MSDVATIAAVLTRTQRAALLAGSSSRLKTGRQIMRHAKIARWPSRPNYRDFSFCWQYGPPGPWGVLNDRKLSPLGQAVRTHISGRQSLTKGESA